MSAVQDIFIGIDGGGTKTKVRVEDAAGNVLGQAIGGPSNIRLSVDAAWTAILQTIEKALTPLNISLQHQEHYRFHVGMGLAGCEVKPARDEFLNRSHLFTTLKLVLDAHAACVGAHQTKDGAIIIVGTGVIGYQIQAGESSRVSGWGFPHDDEGGGAWLGLEATRLTFQWLDNRTEKSLLAEDVFAYFDHDLEHFVTWANRANSSEFAKLAPLVINHSQQSELESVRLMKKAAHAVEFVHAALKKTQINSLPCCLLGGIAPFIEPWLSEELKSVLSPRQADACAGAILMAKVDIRHTIF